MLLYSCCNFSSVGVDDRCDVPTPEQMRDVAERLICAANADRRIVVDDRAAINLIERLCLLVVAFRRC